MSARDLSHVTTLVFDVLGTVLDEDAALLHAAQEASSSDTDPAAFAAAWSARTAELLAAVVDGRAGFAILDVLQRRALDETCTAQGLTLPEEALERLSRFGHRIPAFGDSRAAIEDLARSHTLVALTNAGLSQALDMSAAVGLRWSTIASAETVGAYKPDDRMYAYAIERLGVDPSRALFVAAHPWDLDAAAGHGFGTAYIDRSSSSPGQLAGYAARYDLAVSDLAALAAALDADLG